MIERKVNEMKKLLVTILAIVMTLTMTVATANADEPTHSYKAYQVFAGAVDGSTISGVQWGTGVDGTDLLEELKGDPAFYVSNVNVFNDCNTARDVARLLNNLTAAQKNAFARVAANNAITTPEDKGIAVGDTAVAEGYYVIVDVTASVSGKYIEKDIPLLKLTNEDKKLSVTTKTVLPTIDKVAVAQSGDSEVEVNDILAAVGDTVTFRLKGTISENLEEYTEYTMNFSDTLPAGLTYKEFNSITFDGTAMDSDDIETYLNVTTTNKTTTFSLHDLETYTNAKSGGAIVIEYTATVNSDATCGATGNVNTAELQFSNNPSDTESYGKTPGDSVKVYTLQLTVNKVDNDNQPLTGAGFTLYKGSVDDANKIGSELKGTDMTSFVWKGLTAGDYVLVESTVPTGYTEMEDYSFSISADTSSGLAVTASEKEIAVDSTTQNLSVDIVNTDTATMPETGGMGTILFYALGAMLVCGGIVMMMLRKRQENK